ncbi:MAG: beta-N-acetylhexosaminidase [Treponema sp.]|nr:beta-N-acetylhexosaminidase [Treponema sp.]
MSDKINIIPKPLFIEDFEKTFAMQAGAVSLHITGSNSEYIYRRIRTAFSVAGIRVSNEGFPVHVNVLSSVVDCESKIADESYSFSSSKDGVCVEAKELAGAFYGCISVAQLINGCEGDFPVLSIKDKPEFCWRGFLLDTCRSFYSVNFIKKMLDSCALHKLNVFHWHLTDDQGWRFNVPDFPRLTEVGSVRQDLTVPSSEEGFYDEGKTFRRWYTDEEIKEIVCYAQERCIQIVPEIEFPGHSSALLAAYPEYGCTGGPYNVENRWGIFPDVMCLGNDEVFTIYKAALCKIVELFPGKYIHIGGDECLPDRWAKCPKCLLRMKKEGLDTPAQLQAWGTAKIAAMVASLGKIPIGWDEVLDNNKHNKLPDNVIVQSWRGTEGGVKAAAMNHSVIMSPCEFFYLNLKNKDSFEEPGRLGVTTVKKTYSFSPVSSEFEKLEQKKLILGGECALWTEKLPHSRNAEYLLFPRFCAAAESLWLPAEKKDFEDFRHRLEIHKKLLHSLDYRFYEGDLE